MLQVIAVYLRVQAVEMVGGLEKPTMLLICALLMRANCAAIAQSVQPLLARSPPRLHASARTTDSQSEPDSQSCSEPDTESGSDVESGSTHETDKGADEGESRKKGDPPAMPQEGLNERTVEAVRGCSVFLDQQGSYSRPVPLLHLLRGLFAEEAHTVVTTALAAHSSRMLDGVVCFNHFQLVQYEPGQFDVTKMLERYMAAVCISHTQGVDIILPVALPKIASPGRAGRITVDVHDPSTFDPGAVYIHVYGSDHNFSTRGLYSLSGGEVGEDGLREETVLHVIVSVGNANSRDFPDQPAAVLTASPDTPEEQASAESSAVTPVVLQVLRCLDQVHRPPCMTQEMLAAMRHIRHCADPLAQWREDQKRLGTSASAMNRKLQGLDPGLLHFDSSDEDPFCPDDEQYVLFLSSSR
jgi:hypothetical protein